MRRDSYLDDVCPSMKMDTWNKLRKAPLYVYGLYPDGALNVEEQDINKFESHNVSVPSEVGPQHSQKPKYCYNPYDKNDSACCSGRWHQEVVVQIATVFQRRPGATVAEW